MSAKKPHVSAAVKQLRGWVTLACLCVCVCSVAQMLLYGFAQYTDVRWQEVKTVSAERNLKVVTPEGPVSPYAAAPAGEEGGEGHAGPDHASAGGVRGLALDKARETTVERVKSDADRLMNKASTAACSVGTLSLVSLAILTFLGVLVAGGASVPGVEKCVTSFVWALILGLLCLPWWDLSPALRIPGVFAGYQALAASADRAPGALQGLAAVGQWVGMPIVAAVGSVFIAFWFRAGVERGVIITSVSELDAACEKEIQTIARQGAGGRVAKTIGALNRAVGDVPRPVAVSPVETALDQASAIAASLAREARGGGGGGRSAVDEDYKRPI